jgi:hypothetical protein
MSQYDARICAIGSTAQNKGELLLGDNDQRAARNMHLKSEEWNRFKQTSTAQFLLWVKRHVLHGLPVVIGVYDNADLLGTPGVTDPQYDHIVPVVRIRSHHPLSGRRIYGNDHITFSDNGLFGTSRDRPYLYTYSFGGFPASRMQVEGNNGPLYGLPDYGRNFGIVITGVMDADGDTLPVRVTTSKNYEIPVMKRKSTTRPAPMPLTLTITVSKLTPGVDYKLYRYDRLAAVPDTHFNAHASAAAESWNIRLAADTTFTLKRNILSDEIAVYRAVKASAP